MADREQTDMFFGDPRERGSAHPDAVPVEDEITELLVKLDVYEHALVKIAQMDYGSHVGDAIGIARKALREGA